jgi:hypothetical protein
MSDPVPARHRATIGRYLEESIFGDFDEHSPGRTITEAGNVQFSRLAMACNPMHCDPTFAAGCLPATLGNTPAASTCSLQLPAPRALGKSRKTRPSRFRPSTSPTHVPTLPRSCASSMT